MDDRIRSLLEEGRRPREIAAALAAETGLPRRELYARAVRAQGVDRDEGADAGRDAEGAT